MSVGQTAGGQFVVSLISGGNIICASQEDAELIRDANRRYYEGNTGRRLPRRTLEALERAGHYAHNSMLYRSAMHNLESES